MLLRKSLLVDNVVDWLSGHMKGRYCSMRLKKYKQENDPWPPIKTKSYVSLAIVHLKELQTSQETTATIHLRTKGDIHKIPHAMGTEKLTSISQIFDPVSGRVPNSILIEGHAGIGKTTFVKQICIEWSEDKLLTSDKLVLLLLLRDPNVQKITNECKLIEHFTKYSTAELHTELVKNHGADITLIIDGFDELNTELRHESFFRELIEKRCLPKAKIVVTSRPSASACLHDVVDTRIEILGFEQSSKNQYVIEALQDSPSKLKKLQRHFQQYPNIDAICYIPLIMSIIVFLCKCQPDDLPPTATTMYASFILHTICHYLKRVGKVPGNKTISTLAQFPPIIHKALQELEKTAFDGLVMDKIVFTVEELPVLCKDDPTCYGLLQSTECYSAEEIGAPTQSFNFLHLGIQEYFAAKYVTTLPEDEVYTLLKGSFSVSSRVYNPNPDSKSVRLSNMWILYCGITSGQCKILRHLLSTYDGSHIYDVDEDSFDDDYDDGDNIDDDYSNDEVLASICGTHMSLHGNEIEPTLSHPSTASVVSHLSNPLEPPSINPGTISQDVLRDPVKVLYLFQCFQEAQDDELCEILSKSFDNGIINIGSKRLLPHQVVSLGFFLLKSHGNWKELSLYECYIGDHGMNIVHQYLCKDKQEIVKIDLSDNYLTEASSHLIADIINHLQPHTLLLHNNNITNVNHISAAVINTSAVKVLSMENNGLTLQAAVAISNVVSSLERLFINHNEFGDHGAELLSEGIINSKVLRILNISHNNIGASGTAAIVNALKTNSSLEQLYLIGNEVDQDRARTIANVISSNKALRKLSLGDDTMDKESSMIVIRSLHCNSITELQLPYGLCNDDIVKEEVMKINNRRKEYNLKELILK